MHPTSSTFARSRAHADRAIGIVAHHLPSTGSAAADVATQAAQQRGGGPEALAGPWSALWPALFGEAALPAATLAWLGRAAQRRRVAAGTALLTRGVAQPHLLALEGGEVAVGLAGAGGWRARRLLQGPAWLDLSAAWVGQAPVIDAQAQTEAWVVELAPDALVAHLNEHPALLRRLIEQLAGEVQALAAHTHALQHMDAPARLAQWLVQRCQAQEAGGRGGAAQAVVRLDQRKRDLASQLAITPETLSRLMRSFSRQGVIEVSGYVVQVLDRAALMRLAQA